MKPWKIGMTVIAGIGLFVGIVFTATMSLIAFGDIKYLLVQPPFGIFDVVIVPFIWAGCLFGLVLALIGGLSGRPRNFWQLCVAIGSVYTIASSIVMFAEQRFGGNTRLTLMTLWMASPGIVFIIEGFLIRYLRNNQNINDSAAN